MSSTGELLATYQKTEDLGQAELILEELDGRELPDDLRLGDLYDGLAEVAADYDDYDLAVRAQRRALELGCDYREVGEASLAWYLLKAGRKEEGEGAFERLQDERRGDPEIILTLANARMDSGDEHGAIEAFDEALRVAKHAEDAEWIDQIRIERQYVRSELGIEPDEDDRLAGHWEPIGGESQIGWSLAWFPRDQIKGALARWPSLEGDLGDADEYCRSIEATLREMTASTGKRPTLAPLRVDQLVRYAGERGLDPDSGEARSQLAAHIGRRREGVPWPPGRNDPCWCGSGQKYKRCCELAGTSDSRLAA